ncbi:MAG: transaldolase family protein, partial [Patescibacteria group bacterium]
MKLFVDTANLKDIEEALKRGFVRGVTTNPSLLAKEPKAKFEEHIGKIVELIKKYQPEAHLSVEVFSRDPDEILKQATGFAKKFLCSNLSVKIQIGWNE